MEENKNSKVRTPNRRFTDNSRLRSEERPGNGLTKDCVEIRNQKFADNPKIEHGVPNLAKGRPEISIFEKEIRAKEEQGSPLDKKEIDELQAIDALLEELELLVKITLE